MISAEIEDGTVTWVIVVSAVLPSVAVAGALLLLLLFFRARARRIAAPKLECISESSLAFLPEELSEDTDTLSAMMLARPAQHHQTAVTSLAAEASAVEAGADKFGNGAAAVAAALPHLYWQLAHVSMNGLQVSVCPPLLVRGQAAIDRHEQSLGGFLDGSQAVVTFSTDADSAESRFREGDTEVGPDPGAQALAEHRYYGEQRRRSYLPAATNSVQASAAAEAVMASKSSNHPEKSHTWRLSIASSRSGPTAFRGRGRWSQAAFDWRATNVLDLTRARNERVLRLLGVCDLAVGLKVLVFEYSPLGSLSHLLQEEARPLSLPFFCTFAPRVPLTRLSPLRSPLTAHCSLPFLPC